MNWTLPLIFNPNGSDSKIDRKIWKGNSTNLIQLNDIKYGWSKQLYDQMRGNFWIPQRNDLTADINDYQNLTSDERQAFEGILSYLTFLDSIQTTNIANIKQPITAPEIIICLTEQASQEAMHNESYQYIIQSVIPDNKRNYIYELWRTDKVLQERCEYIASSYQDYQDYQNEETYFKALVADYILESIYFFNGFTFFFTLSSRQLMCGTADIISLIKRDELSHIRLYQKLLEDAINGGLNLPNNWEDYILESFKKAIEHECKWTQHIIGNKVLGITTESTRQYTEYLADIRLKAIGLKGLKSGLSNPYKHLDSIADTGKDATVKSNFFETTVTSYMMSNVVDGWDTI